MLIVGSICHREKDVRQSLEKEPREYVMPGEPFPGHWVGYITILYDIFPGHSGGTIKDARGEIPPEHQGYFLAVNPMLS